MKKPSKNSSNAKNSAYKIISENRKARYNYHIEQTFEAGICLVGTEVKSLRKNKAQIAEAYVAEENGELHLINSHISEYFEANRHNHNPKRPRKLLLHRREIRKLIGQIATKGKSLIPLKVYFNDKNIVKLEIAIATGKKKHDKRAAIKERDIKRDRQRGLE